MDTIASRLQIVRGARSRRSFADELSITESTLRNYEQGHSLPNSDLLTRICLKTGASPDWLLLGQEPMYRDTSRLQTDFCGEREILFTAVETLEEVLDEMEKRLNPAQKAEVVCKLYELIHNEDEKAQKPATILRLIKGALAS